MQGERGEEDQIESGFGIRPWLKMTIEDESGERIIAYKNHFS